MPVNHSINHYYADYLCEIPAEFEHKLSYARIKEKLGVGINEFCHFREHNPLLVIISTDCDIKLSGVKGICQYFKEPNGEKNN